MESLELATAEWGTRPTEAEIEACGYGPVPAVVVSREAWLGAWVAMRGVGGAAAIEEFGRSARELLKLGEVRHVTGGLVWEV